MNRLVHVYDKGVGLHNLFKYFIVNNFRFYLHHLINHRFQEFIFHHNLAKIPSLS